MLNAKAMQSEINCILTKIHEEHAKLQQSCIGLASDASNVTVIAVYIENMYQIRRQLQELVGDATAIAMIAKELETHSPSSEIEQAGPSSHMISSDME